MPRRDTVLVTGGAGYIGSHTVLALVAAGYPVAVIDDLSTGRRDAVPAGIPFVEGSVGDAGLLSDIFARHDIATVIHFAGAIVVPESVVKPLDYYRRNTVASHTLIETAVAAGIGRFVFSSSAAVYGMPDTLPVGEDAATRPVNPYGASKLMTEWMLRDAAAAHRLQVTALRYFNVAGADPAGRAGQTGPVATHLIKIACQAATGQRGHIDIFGDDYDTPDGTCIRDYIHVSDLADAHVAALRHLDAAPTDAGCFTALNCGYGHGYSVRDVLTAVERAAGKPLDIRIAPRRAGDPPALVADARKIAATLNWRPAHDDLDGIVRSALAWERQLPVRG